MDVTFGAKIDVLTVFAFLKKDLRACFAPISNVNVITLLKGPRL
jgi:hypothetical protein